MTQLQENILLETVQSTQTSIAFITTSFPSTTSTLGWTSKHTRGCIDCEWITLKGSQSQHLKAADMNHVLSCSAFNPAYVIKDGRGGSAAATSGRDGEGILIKCEPFCHAKPYYLTTLKLSQGLPRLLLSFLINSLTGLMKESCLMKNHHQSPSTHLELKIFECPRPSHCYTFAHGDLWTGTKSRKV